MERKSFKIYLGGAFYDTFKYKENKKIYQGHFGYLPLETMLDVINGLIPHIKVEVTNE